MTDEVHEQKPKFANENAKAQSNLREKNKTFSFQLGDCTDSDNEVMEPSGHQDISDTKNDDEKIESVAADLAREVAQSKADPVPEMIDPLKAGGKAHKNPFAMRLFQRSQELSASQLSQMRRNQMKLQKQ